MPERQPWGDGSCPSCLVNRVALTGSLASRSPPASRRHVSHRAFCGRRIFWTAAIHRRFVFRWPPPAALSVRSSAVRSSAFTRSGGASRGPRDRLLTPHTIRLQYVYESYGSPADSRGMRAQSPPPSRRGRRRRRLPRHPAHHRLGQSRRPTRGRRPAIACARRYTRRVRNRRSSHHPARRRPADDYPRFFRRGDELVKVGWSKKDRREYNHRARARSWIWWPPS